MSSASSAVTYTSVYTDSEPGRVFWGADEELSDEGSPQVIVYGYDVLPMLPVAPPSPDYIPGLEEPQTPPAPQDEDEHEPMFIQPHDPDFLPEPIYPEIQRSMRTRRHRMDEDEEEEEEHLALADSAIVIPSDELVAPPEGTEPASISLSPEAEVERLLAMPTPSPSLLTSLSPPFAGERLARCTALASLPSPPLPPPLHMPLPIDRRDDIPETPPRKRLCLSTLGSSTLNAEARRRGIGEVGYGIRDTWIDPSETVPEIAPMTVGEVNTRVTELAKLHEHDTQDLYALFEDAQDSKARISQRASSTDGRDSPSDERHETRDGRHAGRVVSTTQIMAPVTRQRPSTLTNNTNPNNMTLESVQAMIDQVLLRNSTNGDGSHSSQENNRRNVQSTRLCFYADFMKCQPLNSKGTECMVGLSQWIEKME
nr:hypothetical protein [Tanacetum cinerariifolium]